MSEANYAADLDTVYTALAQAIGASGDKAELMLATLSLSLVSELLQSGKSVAEIEVLITQAKRLAVG